MKFMAVWSIDQDKWPLILQTWNGMTPEQIANPGEGVKLIGRWHDLTARTGVVILESDSALAVHRALNQWNPHLDIEVNPVLDDEECTEAIKLILADQAG